MVSGVSEAIDNFSRRMEDAVVTSGRMALLDEPEQLRGALAPLRRQLLARLRTPASATELARELGLTRQKVNYHLRKLQDAGLLELVEERQRRGCVERVLRARADAYVVDPSVMVAAGPGDPAGPGDAGDPGDPGGSDGHAVERTTVGDRHAADHLVAVASQTVREVTRMQATAGRAGQRLLTFTVESAVRLAEPSDLHRFTDALAAAVAAVIADFDTPGGRPYRLVGAGHPVPRPALPAHQEATDG